MQPEDKEAIQQLELIKLRNYVVENMKIIMGVETWEEAMQLFPTLTTREYLERAIDDVKRENPGKLKKKGKDPSKTYVFPVTIKQDIENEKMQRFA